MKKLISMILVLSIMMAMCIPAFASSKVLGDVNDDGKITAVDARIVLQVVAGIKEEAGIIRSNGDVNYDGKISAVDARIILQCVAGIIPAPEIPSGACAHEYGLYEIKKEATCTENGVSEMRCMYCDSQYEKVVFAFGHNYVDGVCENCGEYSADKEDSVSITVSNTQVYIKNSPVVVYVTMTGADTIVHEIEDEKIASCKWGEWDGDVIPLTIYPESNGTTTVEVYAKGYDKRVEIKVYVDKTGPSNRADQKLKNYIMARGEVLENGVYGVMRTISGVDTFMYYYTQDDKFVFACDIPVENQGETTVFMTYRYGESKQDVMTSTNMYSSSKKLVTSGYIYTATFSDAAPNVYITYNDGWTTTQNAKEVTASSTSILLLVMEEYLKYTGTGVTLYSLGFTAW